MIPIEAKIYAGEMKRRITEAFDGPQRMMQPVIDVMRELNLEEGRHFLFGGGCTSTSWNTTGTGCRYHDSTRLFYRAS